MTRINTNVISLNAQKTLARSNVQLQEALTRLSTGLRINSGKDDPAGLIASEVLRSDITSVNRAITNNQRANQMIATADSALGQVSSLLNDIRGLVSEAANSGAMSAEQVAANQLQIDSSLEAIDRIANITQFQGRRLLDGNLDFITTGVDTTKLSDLSIDQANFGDQTEIGVAVDIRAQATQGSLGYAYGAIPADLVLEVGGKEGYEAFNFAAGSKIEDMAAAINLVSDALGVSAKVESGATQGSITISSFGDNNDLVLEAKTPGEQAGNYRVKFVADPTGGSLGVSYTEPTAKDAGTIVVNLETQPWVPASVTIDDTSSLNNAFSITSLLPGSQFNGVTVAFAVDAAAVGQEYATYASGVLTLHVHDNGAGGTDSTANDIISGIKSATRSPVVSRLFTAQNNIDSNGSGTIDMTNAAWGAAVFAGGVDGGEVLSTANDVISAINNTAGLQDLVTASRATGDNGYGVVSPFEEYAFSGVTDANNRLQFLGPEGTRDLRFVSLPGQELGIDLATEPEIDGFSSATIQGTNANTSIVVTARSKGADYDDVAITYHDTGAPGLNAVVWDPQSKTLDVYVQAGTTAQTVVDLINSDTYVNRFFRADNYGVSTGAGAISANDFDTALPLATTAGGVIDPGTILVNLATDADGLISTTAQDLIDYFNSDANRGLLEPLGISVSNAPGSTGEGLLEPTTEDLTFATSGTNLQDTAATATLTAITGSDALITISAIEPGSAYGGVRVVFEDTAAAKGAETAYYDSITKVLTISIKDGATQASDVIAAINDPLNPEVSDLFIARDGIDRSGHTSAGTGLISDTDGGTLSSGVIDLGTEEGAAFLGNEDRTNTGLTFIANEYGSDAFVSVKALNGGTFRVTDSQGMVTDRSTGTDVDVRVNGVQAIGRGLTATVNTSALDLSFTVSSTLESGASTAFTIVGGGAQFQLGPDVVSNQQARMGISSVNTAKLGGVSGRLYELRSGGGKSLENDVLGAARVVDEVVTQITTLRGRLGAFQRTTLDTNINALNDTLESLTEAESSIRDADFAAESARLTRAQILVQSGISVLSIANSSPQNVLALLRNQ